MTQNFGGNPAVYAPLKGHPATDWAFDWNEAIPFIADSYVYSKLNEGHSDPDYYTAVCTIVENGDEVDEIIYGHPNLMPVEVGKTYRMGETAALAGNKGMVFSWGRRITKEEKLAGSRAGTHLHLQRRPVKKVKKVSSKKKYLQTSSGKFKKDGFYYEIKDYNNGFNGCEPIEFNGIVAFLPPVHVPPPPVYNFTRDLYLGVSGEDVRELQKYLNKKGFRVAWFGNGSPGNESSYFGRLTQSALIKFQKANNINPPAGYFGPITRRFLSTHP